MSLVDCYNQAIEQGLIHDDLNQRQMLPHLQRIIDEMTKAPRALIFRRRKKIQGLYLVGPVGGGKTYLMDLFYQYLPEPRKYRRHFLSFMQQIDSQLRQLQGQADPILGIAKQLARQYRLLCLDEFIVTDLAQAMLLGGLLPALIAQDVILVATSNTALADLYPKGINRAYFMPTIKLLQAHCEELTLGSQRDYRLGRVAELNAYLYPLSAENQQRFNKQIQILAAGQPVFQQALMVQERSIEALAVTEHLVCFEFEAICQRPRCLLDYIELASRFETFFIANLPNLSELKDPAPVLLWIQLVDVLYDKHCRLLVSAALPPSELYTKGPFLQDFARTLSRLEEMQSIEYLSNNR